MCSLKEGYRADGAGVLSEVHQGGERQGAKAVLRESLVGHKGKTFFP